jgi:hypothetical protein
MWIICFIPIIYFVNKKTTKLCRFSLYQPVLQFAFSACVCVCMCAANKRNKMAQGGWGWIGKTLVQDCVYEESHSNIYKFSFIMAKLCVDKVVKQFITYDTVYCFSWENVVLRGEVDKFGAVMTGYPVVKLTRQYSSKIPAVPTERKRNKHEENF